MIKEIHTYEELLLLQENDNVLLANDIDCGNVSVDRILLQFKGSLDGQGHTVANLVIRPAIWGDEQSVAMFGYLSHAVIQNIRFDNISFVIDRSVYRPRVAALCYEALASEIKNVKISLVTNNTEEIPLVLEPDGSKILGCELICNSRDSIRIGNGEE